MALIGNEMIALLNYRIEQEEASSRLYYSMSVWLEYNGYFGAASLWKKYAEEETNHASWAYGLLLDLNIKPTVPAIQQPSNDFRGLPQIIALSLKHEIEVTTQCNKLMEASLSAGSHLVTQLAYRYMTEQAEELGRSQYWVDRLEAFGDDKISLRLLDQEMKEKA